MKLYDHPLYREDLALACAEPLPWEKLEGTCVVVTGASGSIGSFLVDNSVAFARRGGYKAVRLDIVPDNIPARRLYESKGFTSAGILDLRRDIPEIPLFEIFELNRV